MAQQKADLDRALGRFKNGGSASRTAQEIALDAIPDNSIALPWMHDLPTDEELEMFGTWDEEEHAEDIGDCDDVQDFDLATPDAGLMPDGPEDEDEKSDKESLSTQKTTKKTVDDLIAESKPGQKTDGRSTLYEKPGGYDDAVRDFDSMNLNNKFETGDGIRIGYLPDRRTVNVRIDSKEGRPTLEIFNPKNRRMIKFRYGDKL